MVRVLLTECHLWRSFFLPVCFLLSLAANHSLLDSPFGKTDGGSYTQGLADWGLPSVMHPPNPITCIRPRLPRCLWNPNLCCFSLSWRWKWKILNIQWNLKQSTKNGFSSLLSLERIMWHLRQCNEKYIWWRNTNSLFHKWIVLLVLCCSRVAIRLLGYLSLH